MLFLPFCILFAATSLCFGLSRRVSTRRLGLLAVGAAIAAGATLVVLALRTSLPLSYSLFRWEIPNTLALDLVLRLDMPALGLGLVVLIGGALLLLLLALALAPDMRGFGGLFGGALLVQAAALLALLCSTPLLWPFAWSLVGLVSFATAWSSGTLRDGVDSSLSLLYTLPASLLLLVGLLLSGDGADGVVQGAGAALCVALATAMAAGLPPFRGALDNMLHGPAALAGLLTGVGMPLVALATLWRLVELSPYLQSSSLWRYGLAGYGLLSLATCASEALGERHFKGIMGATLGAQTSVVFVALAFLRLDDQASNPSLLLSNLALTTVAFAAVIAGMERQGRGDDYTHTQDGSVPFGRRGAQFLAAGWGLAAASALGLPPLWGFWGYRQLVANILTTSPWVMPPLLFGLTLLAFALLLPLGGFLSAALSSDEQLAGANRPLLWAVLPGLYLLLTGTLPLLGWPLVAAPSSLAQAVVWGALVFGVGALLLLRRLRAPIAPADADTQPAILAADALGESVAPLAWLGRPNGIIGGVWQGLLGLGEVVQFVMSLFERRYYLAGVLLALLSVLLIMAQ